MTRSPKILGLACAITVALAACQKTEAPAETAAAPAPIEATTPSISFTAGDVDPAVSICADLNAHVNGKWLAANPVPADRTSWGSFETLNERSLEVQHALAQRLAADANASGTGRLVGDVWATGMDEAAIEAAGLTPIQPILDEIAALQTPEQIAAFIRASHAKGQPLVFDFGPSPDFQDSTMNIGYATQSGLGLPDRPYYFDDEHAAKREAYVAHIARMLQLAGTPEAEAAAMAKDVMAFETRLAGVSKTTKELQGEIGLYYEPATIAEADALTPDFKWSEFFAAQGIDAPQMFSLPMRDFHREFNTMLRDVPAAQWQAYLRFRTLSGAAPFLPDAYVQENFAFYGKTMRGQEELQPRWKRVLGTVNGQLGEALGQEYVQVAFSPEAKARMEQLVANLMAALKTRLENLDWMSDETRARALEKWAAFTPKIGYPDEWRDWTGLETSRDSYVGNVLAATQFNYRWNIAKIGKPVDRSEWGMTPQTVNATFNPFANEITFPAAILQPPFFDLEADDALNYGGIGAVIGHEMIHGYDNTGSQFDAVGNKVNWWSDEDKAAFEARTGLLARQFDEYEALPGQHVDGTLTIGENIADLGGMTVAFDALQKELENNRVGEIDGYTPNQRFFLNFATIWRRHFKQAELEHRLRNDEHAPANFRAIGAPSNFAPFAEAFGCKVGDAMVRPEESTVRIW